MASGTVLPRSASHYPGKGALDLFGVSVACLALGPIAVGAAVAAWIEEGHSPFVLQPCVGRGRKPFRLVRFRSASRGRPSGVGRILQRTGFSELPQLINVLRGDMSLVGPRPLSAQETERLRRSDPGCDWRFDAKPGITGLAQLLAGADPRFAHRLDRLYLEQQSVRLDVSIIAASVAAQALRGPRARRWLRRLTATGDASQTGSSGPVR